MSQHSLKNQDNLVWNKNCFPNKNDPNEDLVLVIREDISVLGIKTFKLILIFFAFLFGRIILAGYIDNALWSSLYDTLFFSANTILVITFSLIFHNYYLSLQIVTSNRIIDIDQKSLFNRETNEISLDNIEDVSSLQNGFLSVLFGYGDVIIQSSGESNNKEVKMNGFIFNNVPQPADIAAGISALCRQDQKDNMVETAKLNAEYIKKAMQQKSK